MEDIGAAVVEDVDVVVVGELVAGIIGPPVQVVVGLAVGLEVPRRTVVVDLLMEAMVVEEVVVAGMVEVEAIRQQVEVVSKGGGNLPTSLCSLLLLRNE